MSAEENLLSTHFWHFFGARNNDGFLIFKICSIQKNFGPIQKNLFNLKKFFIEQKNLFKLWKLSLDIKNDFPKFLFNPKNFVYNLNKFFGWTKNFSELKVFFKVVFQKFWLSPRSFVSKYFFTHKKFLSRENDFK